MKNTLLSFLLLLLFSCSNSGHRKFPLLVRADSLIQKGHSDSALIILENISLGELNTSASQAKYALLLTQARDKNYVTHTDDSLIRVAVDYYDSSGDLASRAKAHYYWGRVCQDMDSVNTTVREFLTAIPLAKKVGDYGLLGLLYGSLGYFYWVNGLLEEADSLYLEEIKLAEIHKDSLHWALALSNRGKVYMEKGKEYYFEAEECLKLAYTIIENTSQSTIYVKKEVMSSLAFLYERTDRSLEAISLIKSKQTIQVDTSDLCRDYILLASAYFKTGNYDHATFYLNKCLFAGNYGVKEGAYMRLADIARIKGRDKDALFYENCRMLYKDSVRLQEKPTQIISLSKDIVHKQIAHRYTFLLHYYRYLIGMVTVLLSLVVVLYLYKRKCAKRNNRELLGEYKNVLILYRESEHALDEKEKEILVLNSCIEKSDGDRINLIQYNKSLRDLLAQKREICNKMETLLLQKEKLIENLQRKKFEELIKETAVYQRLSDLIKENKKNSDLMSIPEESDWNELIMEINNLLPGFVVRLSCNFKELTDRDIRFCCLMRIGFKKTEMQFLFACVLDTVYKHEKAMLGKRMKLNTSTKLKEILNEI